VRQPYVGFVTVARKLFPDALRPSSLFGAQGVSPGATIHSTARLESAVMVDPGAVIGPESEIGSGTVIGPNVVIGPKVKIGRDCAIGAGASVMHALLGDRVILHPGCRIGQDGFGFLPTPTGAIKVPQLRRVIIQDNVEIGANTTIDRGQIRDTVIGEGTKIDNLVQIGHNVTIGRFCLLASQTGISGSTEVGDYVMMGGQVGISDNKKIGNGVVLAGRAGVTSDVPNNQRWGGFPARPVRDWLKAEAVLRQLARERGAAGEQDADADERGTE
jgi:UDP-3-O-[3-hydroxymyristoyl] glucosamine N-acyltransferase